MSFRPYVLLSTAVLAGCTGIPSSGPSASAFVNDAKVSSRGSQGEGILLLPVDARVMSYTASEARPTLRSVAGLSVPAEAGIGVGDLVSVSIFEAGVGGLFSSAGANGSASPMTRLPEQTVGRDGSITVPYAGRLRIAGLSPSAAEQRIVAALKDRAIEPQVVVAVAESVSSSIAVTGDAVAGTPVPVPVGGLRVLDAISRAGGPTAPLYETSVTLTRGNGSASVPMSLLASDPSENVYVRGGDALLLTRSPRTFVALGATGRNARVPLQGYEMTLVEALAEVGGLSFSQSNAAGVFVMRRLPFVEAGRLVPDHPLVRSGAAEVPVVYQFNMREPQGLVYAQTFRVRDGDILYVSTASLASVRNTLSIFSGIASPAISTAAAASSF